MSSKCSHLGMADKAQNKSVENTVVEFIGFFATLKFIKSSTIEPIGWSLDNNCQESRDQGLPRSKLLSCNIADALYLLGTVLVLMRAKLPVV